MYASIYACLNWRVVGGGLRPRLCSEMIGQATLPPFPSCLYPKVRPPSVRWNASMAFAHKFVNFAYGIGLCIHGCHFWTRGQLAEVRVNAQLWLSHRNSRFCFWGARKHGNESMLVRFPFWANTWFGLYHDDLFVPRWCENVVHHVHGYIE